VSLKLVDILMHFISSKYMHGLSVYSIKYNRKRGILTGLLSTAY